MYDAIGRQVKKIERSDSNNAPIRFGEDLKAGAYIVEVRQGGNRKTIKLVKQKGYFSKGGKKPSHPGAELVEARGGFFYILTREELKNRN